jgi:lipoyl(octanoyl) transferase
MDRARRDSEIPARHQVAPQGRPLRVLRLGRLRYGVALELQRRLVEDRRSGRLPDTLLLIEHNPVITYGRNAKPAHRLRSNEELQAMGVECFATGRGGDVTYHGPGQLVAYPILNLAPDRCDVHGYVRDLEEVMIRICADFGVKAGRLPGLTGTWVGGRKIGAIGERISQWVTCHGFALNVCNDLTPFQWIVPCGIHDRGVTSLANERKGKAPTIDETMTSAARHIAEIFGRVILTGDDSQDEWVPADIQAIRPRRMR